MLMKKIILIFLAAFIATVGAAAQDDGGRKLTKKERKALEARMDSLANAKAVKAIDDTAFVLEADHVMFTRGYLAHVDSNTNFLAFNGGEAVVQVAFNVPWPGFNGLGGISVEGNVSKYKKTTDKRGNTYIEANVSGTVLSARLFITLYGDSNKATVDIQQNFYSGRITLNGVIVPAGESGVFQGVTI